MTQVLIGCCSWADKSLIESGRFYPKGVKTAEGRLRYYAEQFPIVEIDSTYYGLPEQMAVRHWVARTPPGFVFNVKAFRALTGHQTPRHALAKGVQAMLPPEQRAADNVYYHNLPTEVRDELWRGFSDILLALDSAGKLGAAVFQFPPWFTYSHANLAFIAHCRETLPMQFRMAVEFRNSAWLAGGLRGQTLRFLREQGVALVCVDGPQGFRSSIPPLAEATSPDLAMVRFHGRNAQMWEEKTKSSIERFDWCYSDEELAEWAPRVAALAQATGEVHLMMNTNRFDQGPANARRLGRLLADIGVPVAAAEPEGKQMGLPLGGQAQ